MLYITANLIIYHLSLIAQLNCAIYINNVLSTIHFSSIISCTHVI